jgi:large subunit ribosomal protein L17
MKEGRSLSRRREHRKSMLANMASSLIKSERIRTTEAKAKEIRPFVERMVTFAKRGDLHARRIVHSRLRDADAVKKLFDVIGPRYKDRLGGYTRILKLGFRKGDNSPVSLIEFVEEELPVREKKTKKASKKKKSDSSAKSESAEKEGVEEKVEEQEAAAAEEETTDSEKKAESEPAQKEEAEKPAEASGDEEPADDTSGDDVGTESDESK